MRHELVGHAHVTQPPVQRAVGEGRGVLRRLRRRAAAAFGGLGRLIRAQLSYRLIEEADGHRQPMGLAAVDAPHIAQWAVEAVVRGRRVEAQRGDVRHLEPRSAAERMFHKVDQPHAVPVWLAPVGPYAVGIAVARVRGIREGARRLAAAAVQHVVKSLAVLGRAVRLELALNGCEALVEWQAVARDAHEVQDTEGRIFGKAEDELVRREAADTARRSRLRRSLALERRFELGLQHNDIQLAGTTISAPEAQRAVGRRRVGAGGVELVIGGRVGGV